jgi:CheY-like chemotaxis protein
LKSKPGTGSEFWFVLPLKQALSSASQIAPQTQTLKSLDWPVRFLVVDDHAVNRLLVQRRLMTTWPKAQVIELVDGAQAVDWLQTHSCDLVLMDMIMPVMDGIEAIQRIRRSLDSRIANMLVIGLTANVNALDLRRFQEAGLNGLHLKPYDWAELCKEMDELLISKKTLT